MKNEKLNSLTKMALFLLPLIFLTSCTANEKAGFWGIMIIILIIVGIVIVVSALNRLLDYLAIHFGFVYFPLGIVAALVVFFWARSVGLFAPIGDGTYYRQEQQQLVTTFAMAHVAILYYIIPRPDDVSETITQSTLEYSYGEWRETKSKTFNSFTSGFVIKLIFVAIAVAAFTILPSMFGQGLLFLSMILEVAWCGILTLISIRHRFFRR